MLYTRLRSFHAVATYGGFTAAGDKLCIGQPTITRQVRELEEYFDVELFLRQGREVKLTVAGNSLLEITRRMFTNESAARDFLNAAGGLQTGQLALGAVGPFHVTEIVATFHERYPNISLSINFGNSQVILENLMAYKTDVAVLAKSEDNDKIFSIPYSRHPVIAFVNRNHPLAGNKKISLKRLAGELVLLREKGSTTRLAFETALEQAGTKLSSVIEIGSREAVWWAVVQGLGVGIVSEYEFIPNPELRMLRISDAKIDTYQHIACIRERQHAPLIRQFLELARETSKV